MANERAYGRNATLLHKKETTYGTSAGGNFIKLPFISTDIGKEIKNIKTGLAGAGRGGQKIFQDVPVVGGEIVMPLCLRNTGFMLTRLLGNPTTAEDTGVFTHTFGSVGETLPAASYEVGHPSVPAYYLNLGYKVNTMTLKPERGGPALITFGLIGQNETKNATTQGGTPSEISLAWASNYVATIKQGGSVIANLNSAEFTYSNNLIGIGPLGNGGLISGIDPDDPSCSGTLESRFSTAASLDAATAGTPVDLEFKWSISAALALTCTIHEAYLEKTKVPVQGPGGVNSSLRFEAVKNAGASQIMTTVLVNDQAGTVYT